MELPFTRLLSLVLCVVATFPPNVLSCWTREENDQPEPQPTEPQPKCVYRGQISTTATGRSCQKWTSKYPHEPRFTPASAPNTGLGNHNFCRNPDNDERGPWCYTTDPNKRWEYCDVGNPCEEWSEECGRPDSTSNNRIISGNDVADIRTWPWSGFLGSAGSSYCGATLISWQWAITAAHCVPGKSTAWLTLGVLKQSDTKSQHYKRTLTTVFEHRNYNSHTKNNDIALLKLNEPVQQFNSYIKPVCLGLDVDDPLTEPEISYYGSISCANDRTKRPCCYVAGWGRLQQNELMHPDTMQDVWSPLISRAACRSRYDYSSITEQMICTSTSQSSGSCKGDSGGPMVCKNADGRWDLVGVTSWGSGCGNPNYPDVTVSKSVRI